MSSVRWDGLRLDDQVNQATSAISGAATAPAAAAQAAQAALFGRDAVARTFDTPGFRGMTFYEVR